jgi:hypothetical protein
VLELLTNEKGLLEASREYQIKDSREYQIKDSVLSRWRQEFLERAPQVFEQPGPISDPKDDRIAELERLVGRLALQLDMAKKVFGPSNFPSRENE